MPDAAPTCDAGVGLLDVEGKVGESEASAASGASLLLRFNHFIPGNLLRRGLGNLLSLELLQPVVAMVNPQAATTKTRVRVVRLLCISWSSLTWLVESGIRVVLNDPVESQGNPFRGRIFQSRCDVVIEYRLFVPTAFLDGQSASWLHSLKFLAAGNNRLIHYKSFGRIFLQALGEPNKMQMFTPPIGTPVRTERRMIVWCRT